MGVAAGRLCAGPEQACRRVGALPAIPTRQGCVPSSAHSQPCKVSRAAARLQHGHEEVAVQQVPAQGQCCAAILNSRPPCVPGSGSRWRQVKGRQRGVAGMAGGAGRQGGAQASHCRGAQPRRQRTTSSSSSRAPRQRREAQQAQRASPPKTITCQCPPGPAASAAPAPPPTCPCRGCKTGGGGEEKGQVGARYPHSDGMARPCWHPVQHALAACRLGALLPKGSAAPRLLAPAVQSRRSLPRLPCLAAPSPPTTSTSRQRPPDARSAAGRRRRRGGPHR